MLTRVDLKDVPDELANRMMMRHGSGQLLRALRGEAEPPAEPMPKLRPTSPHPRAIKPKGRGVVPQVARELIAKVAGEFCLDPEDITSDCRSTLSVLARAIIIRILRDRTWANGEPRLSTTTIGRYLNRDHSSVCHALRMFDTYCEAYPEVQEVYDRLKAGA